MIWTVGDVKIVSIVEQALEALDVIIPGATPEVVRQIDWLTPYYANADGEMTGLIQAFIIDTGTTRIVVDTCVGDGRDRPLVESWHRQQRNTLAKFSSAGYPPDTIDVVLCTHLHVDHVGWNTYYNGDAFVPTFNNARYLFARTEFDFWQSENDKEPTTPRDGGELEAMLVAFGDMMKQAFADSIQPVVEAGLADLVDTNHQVCDGVRLVPSPGHTPGHVCVEVTSGEARALITGDAMHHPCQMAYPELGTVIDTLPDTATETRRELLSEAADSGMLVIGSHFSEPSGGHVRRDGRGFRLYPKEN